MTRRVPIFVDEEGIMFAAQEFNGDIHEAKMFGLCVPETANWEEVDKACRKARTLSEFKIAIFGAEESYGYDHIGIKRISPVKYFSSVIDYAVIFGGHRAIIARSLRSTIIRNN